MPFVLKARPEMVVLATGEEIRDKLLDLPDATRAFVVTRPGSGDYRVISVERRADGQMQFKYSDVAEV